jgi:putative two-component system response regulator
MNISAQSAALTAPGPRGMRVLIVDDEPGVRRVVARILSACGGACEMAGTAEEALDRLARDHFDVGLLDIALPGMDGLSLARRIEERYPDLALVMVTGMASFEAAVAAMQIGAVDYLVKPFTAEALTRAFARAVDRRRIRLEAAHALGFQQAIAERTLEISLLLSHPAESAEALVIGFVSGLRMRSAEAADHAERVAESSRRIAQQLRLDEDQVALAARVGLLHDLGKLTLPDALLCREEPLSSQEIQLVRRHPEFGHDVLRRIPALAECAEPVLAQLEHHDGSGSPVGLRSERIPLAARIVAVANVYDVMTHPRPHAARQSPDEALQELHICAGVQFDPAVVQAFHAVMGFVPPADDWLSEDGL